MWPVAHPKPVAPPTFNADETRVRVEEGYKRRYRKPGEPILLPHLTRNHPITRQCPRWVWHSSDINPPLTSPSLPPSLPPPPSLYREEQLRRNDVSVTKYRLLILYNNKEICSTGIRYVLYTHNTLLDPLSLSLSLCIVHSTATSVLVSMSN